MNPASQTALILASWLLAGFAAGATHFALLRWNTRLYLGDGVARALRMQLLRMAALTVLLAFAAWHGAMPLLLVATGVSVARPLVIRLLAVAP